VVPALIVVLVLGTAPAVASAQEVRTGGAVTVPAGTTQTGDITVFGGTVVVQGTLDGDIDGAAGSVLIAGTVTGDVEVAAGSVTVTGTVEGDLDTGAGSVTVAEGGRVGGSLSTGAGEVRIAGAVDGDAEIGTDRLTVAPTARIGGNLRYDAETVQIADGVVAGTVERVDGLRVDAGPPFFDGGSLFSGPAFLVFGFLTNALLGALLLLAAPGFARRIVETGTGQPARSAGAGVLTLIGVPVGLVVLAITVVGLPLSLVGFFVFLPLLWVAFVYGAIVVGSWLLGFADSDSRPGALVVGLAVPTVASLVPFSGLLDLAYLLLGLGAFALSALALRRGDRPLVGGSGREPTDPGTEPTEA
jgi:cytoskeletal protein CcmA (bactofilin family)